MQRETHMNKISDYKVLHSLLWKKIDILCHGINNDIHGLLSHYYCCQNPLDTRRTGNVGLQIKLGKERLALNVAVYKEFCKSSPYYLSLSSKGQLCVLDVRDNSTIEIYCPEKPPDWYNCEVEYKDKKSYIGNFILLEGDFTAIASITQGCIYFNMGQPCAFCAIGATSISDYEIECRKNMILSALPIVAEDINITNFHLTGGNTLEPDRGALSYIPYVAALRKKRSDAPIAVEIPPPEKAVQKEVFINLKNIGVDSITINIEFWDDKIRQRLMPIKGNIPKVDYLSAYHNALEIFGPNKVTCGFIVGVESIENTCEGIDILTDQGIITEVYPFKPNRGSLMVDHPLTKTDDIFKVSWYANDAMKRSKILPDKCSGCVKCGACGLTQQLININ